MHHRSKNYITAHDKYSGSVILAKCLGESEGAEVYWLENLDKDRQRAMEKLGALIAPNYVYVHLLPWARSQEFPLTLDSGEPGNVAIIHRPTLVINPVRNLH